MHGTKNIKFILISLCIAIMIQKMQFDAIHPVLYGEQHKKHYVFCLTQLFIFIITFSNTTYFDQSHHPVFILWKNVKL